MCLCMCRLIRKEFILAKYIACQFAQRSGSSTDTLRGRLQEAVRATDIFSLLQLYTEKIDLSLPMPSPLQVHTHTHLNTTCARTDPSALSCMASEHIFFFIYANSIICFVYRHKYFPPPN